MALGFHMGGTGGTIPTPEIPDGRTVTPINDVRIWQKCAGITNPAYSTLTEILTDVGILKTLMASENAVDYLVRCKEWRTGLIPKMMGNTTPSGECFATDVAGLATAYKAFDGVLDESGAWGTDGTTNRYVGYDFGNNVSVKSFKVLPRYLTNLRLKNFKIQSSEDKSTWLDCYSGVIPSASQANWFGDVITSDNAKNKRYFRLLGIDSYDNLNIGIYELQFYATDAVITENQDAMAYIGMFDYAADTLLADADWCEAICNSEYRSNVINTENPIMTSNSAPSGYSVSGDLSVQSSANDFYKAFDNDKTSYYQSASSYGDGHQLSNPKIVYTFPKPFGLARVYLYFKSFDASVNRYLDVTCTIKGSNDGVTYETIAVKQMNYWGSGNAGEYYYYISIPYSTYLKYAVEFDKGNQLYQSRWYYIAITECKFYGRERGTVQSWLKAGGITDKTYTSISEVLNDPVTLAALMASVPAVDYLVTVKKWATEVCANATAMQYIGANNYAANTLLDDDDWCSAICNSTYFEYVLNVSVPIMTSNTTPSGVASASTQNNSAYSGFNGNENTGWMTEQYSDQNHSTWIDYEFSSKKKIYMTKLFIYRYNNVQVTSHSISLLASDDGGTFTELFRVTNSAQTFKRAITGGFEAKHFRMRFNTMDTYWAGGGTYLTIVGTLQFYGRQDA